MDLKQSSVELASNLEENHDYVIEAIKNLECSEGFRLLNFELVSSIDDQGKKQSMYYITRQGLMSLVMGFTGPKFAKWKERFIEGFDAIEKEIAEMSDFTDFLKGNLDKLNAITIDQEIDSVPEGRLRGKKEKELISLETKVNPRP